MYTTEGVARVKRSSTVFSCSCNAETVVPRSSVRAGATIGPLFHVSVAASRLEASVRCQPTVADGGVRGNLIDRQQAIRVAPSWRPAGDAARATLTPREY